MEGSPRVLVTGFGPFPGAPENPTEALVQALAVQPPGRFGAAALHALALPTDYRKSWLVLRRVLSRFSPDVVVHFGLSRKAQTVVVERQAHRACNPDLADAAGFVPPLARARRSGPEGLPSTLPAEMIAAALQVAGIPAVLSDDAGAYVCNATLYRSLSAAPPGRMVGFIHVPPIGQGSFDQTRLDEAAELAIACVCSVWRDTTPPTHCQAGQVFRGADRATWQQNSTG